MQFGILGSLLVCDGETVVPVAGARQRVLLAALLVRAGQPVAADELAETVWDGAPPAGAAATLRSHVMRLRQVLGAAAGARLVTRSPGYLVEAAEEVDLLRFAASCRTGGAAVRSAAWARACGLLDGALGLWRGAPLADVPSEVLHREEVPRLERLRLQALEWRAEAALHLGHHSELVPELQALVAEYPLRERYCGQLMLALYRCGRQAEALHAYRIARAALVTELGVEPGHELRELHQQILAADPALAPPSASAPAAGAVQPAQVVSWPAPADVDVFTRHDVEFTATPPGVLIGRDSDLALLDGLVKEVTAGRGSVLLIEGEPGIGKSALVRAALAKATGLGCQVFWGTGDELGQALPLQPLLDALRVREPSANLRRNTIVRLLRGEVTTDPGTDGPAVMVEQLLALITEQCVVQPVILVIDDLQWADQASIRLWGRLARSVRQVPLLLVGMMRPVPQRDELLALRRVVGNAARLQLAGLTEATAAGLVASLAGGKPDGKLLRLADDAAGNPLYITELVAALMRSSQGGHHGWWGSYAHNRLRARLSLGSHSGSPGLCLGAGARRPAGGGPAGGGLCGDGPGDRPGPQRRGSGPGS